MKLGLGGLIKKLIKDGKTDPVDWKLHTNVQYKKNLPIKHL